MKCKELGDQLGVHRLQVGKARKKLFPESSGELNSEEQEAIRDYISGVTKPKITLVKVVNADAKYPEWVDATIEGREGYFLVKLPYGFESERFIGREINVYEQKVADDQSIFTYSPWI